MNRLTGYRARLVACMVLVSAILAFTSAGLPPRPAHAQASDLIVTIEDVDGSAFPTIRMRVGVRTKSGVPIPDLSVDAFEIVEDAAGVAPPSAASMETNPQAQVSLAIVIDMYKTLAGRPIEAAQAATNELLNSLLAPGNERNRGAFVGVHKGLSTDPTVIHDDYEVPFTNDRNRLLNVINFIHERMEDEPGTPLYDAVIKAVRMAAASEPVGHRALIVMTDGDDRTSVSADSDTIQTANREQTPVFTIGLSNTRLNEQYLRRLADQTGGSYQAAQTPEDFSSMFSNVLTMLRTQYVLTYDAGLPEDGLTHSLLVRVTTPTGLEGWAESRFTTPGVAATAPAATEEEPSEEPTSTSEAEAEATPGPTAEPEAESEGGTLDSISSFIQDNMFLAILIVAAVALLFLIVVIVVVMVIRRRRMGADEELPPIPEAPFAPQPFEAPQADVGAASDWPGGPYGPAPAYPGGGATAAPTATAEDYAGAELGTAPTPSPGGPFAPAPAPPFASPVGQAPGAAGGTQILDRGPKMPVVGLLVDRSRPGRRFDIAKPSVTIGRGQGCDVVIEDGTVSRQHATIKWENGRFRVYDLGSSNGTFVGETRVRQPVVLEDGAAVRFGAVELVFKIV